MYSLQAESWKRPEPLFFDAAVNAVEFNVG